VHQVEEKCHLTDVRIGNDNQGNLLHHAWSRLPFFIIYCQLWACIAGMNMGQGKSLGIMSGSVSSGSPVVLVNSEAA